MKNKSKGVGMSSVETRIKNIVAEQFGINVSELNLFTNLEDDLGADSLDKIELIMALEEEFDIEIPDEEIKKIENLGVVIDYIKTRKLKAG